MSKITRTLTLSVYESGLHRTAGPYTPDNDRYAQGSVAESLSPISFMLNELLRSGCQLGDKVDVTMTVKKGGKHGKA